jgi:NADPH:quinone reductase-like Zn-dependent oxidoreductase
MRAVQFDEPGDPEVLHVADVPEPHAGPDEVRIAVRAAAVNPIDVKFRSGQLKVDLPYTPGFDASGVTDAGEEVFGHAEGGAYAEYVVLTQWAPKPAQASFAEAAGWVMAAETATRALDVVGVGEGDTVVIAGAAGGVGSAAVQIAVARGARVIGAAREDDHEYLRSLGAEATTYGDGLAERVGERVDAGFDTAGKGAVRELITLTGDPAKVVTIADFGAGELGAHVTSKATAWHALAEVAALFDAGRFRLPVAATYPLEQAAEAHAARGRGKVILVP